MTTDPALAAIRQRFDERAATYDDNAMHRALAERVAAYCDLSGVRTVLDVATGTGMVLRALRQRPEAAGLRLAGVDLSAGMLAVARGALPDAALVEADATRLPFGDASVDLLTCVTALHLLQSPAAAFADWARVLGDDGRMVTATFTRRPRRSPRAGPLAFDSHHDAYRTPAQLAEAFAPAGLAPVRHTEWGYAVGAPEEVRVLLAELRPTR